MNILDTESSIKNIAIFASGSGTNAENISIYFKDHPWIKVSCIITNKSDAGVIDRAKNLKIPYLVLSPEILNDEFLFSQSIELFSIDCIVLAGFLLKIPKWMVNKYENKIINIHPAILPGFGGKGMYGMHVHEAVKKSGNKKTGITIHLVNEQYDKGEILLQAFCGVNENMTTIDIARKVHELEYIYYPSCIEYFIKEYCN